MAILTPSARDPVARASRAALYVRRVPANTTAALRYRALTVSVTAALPRRRRAHRDRGRGPEARTEPQPPAQMSTVGGDRLGAPGTQVDAAAGVPALPAKLTSRSWIVADAETGACSPRTTRTGSSPRRAP